MTISCLTFDLDDTLWDCKSVIQRAEQRFFDWLTIQAGERPLPYDQESLLQHRMHFMRARPQLRHDLTQLRKLWLTDLFTEHALALSVEEAFSVYWTARNEVELFAEVKPMLQRCAQHFQLGVITNGNADVSRVGLEGYFDFVIHSERAGVAKPDPAIFAAACATAGTKPENMLHIGDDPARDVVGAKAAGWQAIWFNPRFVPWPGGRNPDHVVRRLDEIPALLQLDD